MRKPFIPLFAIVLSLLAGCAIHKAAVQKHWPARVFAPYMYVGAGDNFKLTDCDDACGLKYYTLACIIAQQDGRGQDAKFLKQPSWDGRIPMEQNYYLSQIEAIRQRGGD